MTAIRGGKVLKVEAKSGLIHKFIASGNPNLRNINEIGAGSQVIVVDRPVRTDTISVRISTIPPQAEEAILMTVVS